jgi:hypothetical protein
MRRIKTRDQKDRVNERQRERYASNSSYRENEKERAARRPRAYRSWSDMKRRVFNQNCPEYHRYKDRHIDPRWMVFDTFLADMGERPRGLTLERIDNSRGYFPENCTWATRKRQTRNRSMSKLTDKKASEIRGLIGTMLQRDIAKTYGVNPTVISKVKLGQSWAVEVANV